MIIESVLERKKNIFKQKEQTKLAILQGSLHNPFGFSHNR